jgi:hypothetical protein
MTVLIDTVLFVSDRARVVALTIIAIALTNLVGAIILP